MTDAGDGAGAEDLRLHPYTKAEDKDDIHQHQPQLQLSLNSASACVAGENGASDMKQHKHKPQSVSEHKLNINGDTGSRSRSSRRRRSSLSKRFSLSFVSGSEYDSEDTSTSSRRSRTKSRRMKTIRSVAGSVHKLIFSNDPDYKRLQEIEKRRRAILKRTDLGFFRMLFFWDGTCLQAVLSETMLWITMLIYVLVRVGAYTRLPTFVSEIGSTDITTVGAFVTFFMVFHTNNTINRFDNIYNASMTCESRIFDAAAIASSTLTHGRALRLVRYMNAAHIAGYVGLGETYGYRNFFLPMNESKQFLTQQELKRIEYINMDDGGSCYRELIVWCCDEVKDALKKGCISEMEAHDLRKCILKLRGSFDTIYDYNDQPIPFFLTHFTVLMTFIFLPLVAIAQGIDAGTGENAYWIKDVVDGVVVFLQAVVLLGLRTLADMLSDPFGDDVHDLSVIYYINFTWLMSNRMVKAARREGVGIDDSDLDLEDSWTNIDSSERFGEAWEDVSKAGNGFRLRK